MQAVVSQAAVDAAFNIAVDRYEAGDLGGAMNILRLLATVAPSDEGVWRALARCHEELEQPEVAEFLRNLSTTIAELDPHDAGSIL
jgi:Flp pilus assembly protein TadD